MSTSTTNAFEAVAAPAKTDHRTIRKSWGIKYRRLYAMPRDSIAIVHQRRSARALQTEEAITQPACHVPAVDPSSEVKASAVGARPLEFSEIQKWLETFE